VRPGLTGLAQVNGRNFVDWDHRLAFDCQYVKEISFQMDVKIIFRTLLQVIKRNDVAVCTDDIEGNLADIRKAAMEYEGISVC
jgi:lipopolysaccharide/colanic/teichoic acid biosynthesis glycosyltransferase